MKKVLIWAVAAMMLAGCDSNNDNVDGEIIPINLSSRLTAEISRSRRKTRLLTGSRLVSL